MQPAPLTPVAVLRMLCCAAQVSQGSFQSDANGLGYLASTNNLHRIPSGPLSMVRQRTGLCTGCAAGVQACSVHLALRTPLHLTASTAPHPPPKQGSKLESIASAAVKAADKVGAALIICITHTGALHCAVLCCAVLCYSQWKVVGARGGDLSRHVHPPCIAGALPCTHTSIPKTVAHLAGDAHTYCVILPTAPHLRGRVAGRTQVVLRPSFINLLLNISTATCSALRAP